MIFEDQIIDGAGNEAKCDDVNTGWSKLNFIYYKMLNYLKILDLFNISNLVILLTFINSSSTYKIQL